MIRELLLVALLAHVAVAQSGTITFSAQPTNAEYIITLGEPAPGMTRVRVSAEARFDQALTLWNDSATPLHGRAIYGDRLTLRTGQIELAQHYRRTRCDVACDPFDTASGATVALLSTGFTATLNALSPPRTFVYTATVRQAVYVEWPFGGSVTHQTTSLVAGRVDWEYLP